ncbi:unnamed protein product [Orchesella dallaii]|uniref:C-type lectin domain-containing protein n=1 Tax=Orchesella dallaii TaxID=48710 RepID=A0ABP1QG93_9HEXA
MDSYTADFYEAANSQCAKLGLTIATIRTDCEYGVFDRWFKVNYPTTYSVWIGAVRFGDDAIWYPSKEPVDFSGFGFRYIPGPYPGYSPVPYPWINCVTVSRNCQPFSAGPTNPCTQTATKPDLQFLYQDCRDKRMRIVCEEPCNMPDEY